MILLNKSEYGFSETKYSHYLCFQVSNRTNRFTARNSDRYSARQKELHDYIKSLHDSVMSYRRITKLLNRDYKLEWVTMEVKWERNSV